jgi:hypothetical protein
MSREHVLAYFDTNVFDNLLKKTGGVTETDLARIRDLVASERLKIIANILNIQETIAAQCSRPEIVRPQLDLIAYLSDWEHFVKPHCFILEDDIRHFAWNGERASPFERDDIVAKIRAATQRARDNTEGMEELRSLAREDRQQKTRFLAEVMGTRDEVAPKIEEFGRQGEILTFGQYFEESAGDFALAFARSFGVSEQCELRGVENLLKIPSVRAFVGLSMSFIYRTAVEGKKPKSSASRDLQHAPSAAGAAEIFVTHDRQLASLFGRVPMRNFKVLSLHQLIQRLV